MGVSIVARGKEWEVERPQGSLLFGHLPPAKISGLPALQVVDYLSMQIIGGQLPVRALDLRPRVFRALSD